MCGAVQVRPTTSHPPSDQKGTGMGFLFDSQNSSKSKKMVCFYFSLFLLSLSKKIIDSLLGNPIRFFPLVWGPFRSANWTEILTGTDLFGRQSGRPKRGEGPPGEVVPRGHDHEVTSTSPVKELNPRSVLQPCLGSGIEYLAPGPRSATVLCQPLTPEGSCGPAGGTL